LLRLSWLPLAVLLAACAGTETRSPEEGAARAVHCADLSRQLAELADRPVRRSEIQRRYDLECAAR
jgi:hypothetical protein